jgi:hypothetical protein
MDVPNAFIGKTKKPNAAELAAALGSASNAWNQFVAWLAAEHGVNVQEWKSISPKFGWSLQLKLKKRTIVHLSPCNNCFRVAIILGGKALEAAQQSKLPKSLTRAIADAPRHTEGTGVRLLVKSAVALPAIHKLVAIKLAN